MAIPFNRELAPKLAGFEYSYFVPMSDVVATACMADGNTYVQDSQGRVFNVHPAIRDRFNHATKKNEPFADGAHYPARWQVLGSYDLPDALKVG